MSTWSRPFGHAHAPLDPRSSPLVIGYGNPLRADDGFGQQVAQRLAALAPADTATILAVHQLTPELAEPVSKASRVIFVDVHEGGPPGELVCHHVSPDETRPATFSHDVDPLTLLVLARTLYGACPPAVTLSAGGAEFGYGVGLSAAVRDALPAALERVAALLDAPLMTAEQGRVGPCMR